ncbi:PH domain-containing protein [Acidisphaera sp. L21]|uniref:PH domain-containing protein n=1 Tax=Acidisphaera sp. L21 TaxID=1641851 RepID=UPI00131CD5B3|nr:PH domain-containing protein [Acidisphaera sp. L21]
MPYYTKVLRPTEQVIFIGRLHWLIYSRGLLVFIVGLLVLMVGIVSPVDIAGHLALPILSILIFAMATLILVVSAIQRVTTEVVVTNLRVIYKTGWLSRTTAEMNTSKIETVDVIQSLAGRVLGFGTVLIRGTGSTFEPLQRIAEPLELRNAILVG